MRSIFPSGRLFIISLAVGSLVAAAPGGDLLVPGQYASIQAAIVSAEDGDRIVVMPGTYQEELFFDGLSLTLIPSSPEERVFIDSPGIGLRIVREASVTAERFDIHGDDPVYLLERGQPAVSLDTAELSLTHCHLTGGRSWAPPHSRGLPGAHALVCSRALSVEVDQCTFTGGHGGGGDYVLEYLGYPGERGGHGIKSNWAEHLIIRSSVLTGGEGGAGGYALMIPGWGGQGGHGLALTGPTTVEVVSCEIRGGEGGSSGGGSSPGGYGGDGIRGYLSSRILLLDGSLLFEGAGVDGGGDGLPLRLDDDSVCVTEASALADYLIGACEADGVIDVIADCNSDEAVDAADVVRMLELLREFEEGD